MFVNVSIFWGHSLKLATIKLIWYYLQLYHKCVLSCNSVVEPKQSSDSVAHCVRPPILAFLYPGRKVGGSRPVWEKKKMKQYFI